MEGSGSIELIGRSEHEKNGSDQTERELTLEKHGRTHR